MNEKKQAEKPKTNFPFDIRFGVHESVGTIEERKKLRQQAAERNYVKEKEEENEKLSSLEKVDLKLTFELNRIAP